jgi:hypothetical protein
MSSVFRVTSQIWQTAIRDGETALLILFVVQSVVDIADFNSGNENLTLSVLFFIIVMDSGSLRKSCARALTTDREDHIIQSN